MAMGQATSKYAGEENMSNGGVDGLRLFNGTKNIKLRRRSQHRRAFTLEALKRMYMGLLTGGLAYALGSFSIAKGDLDSFNERRLTTTRGSILTGRNGEVKAVSFDQAIHFSIKYAV